MNHQSRPYCVGLTGNIACGKSQALNCFYQLNAGVISADAIARDLTAKASPAFNAIVEFFGTTILTAQGDIDRKHLRSIVFAEPTKRHWLEQLLHPLIRQAIVAKINQLHHLAYCVIEIPLLVERYEYPYLDRVLLILAKKSTLISRIITRDQCTPEQALLIIKTQPSYQRRLRYADDVIVNDSISTPLNQQVLVLHQRYLNFSKQSK